MCWWGVKCVDPNVGSDGGERVKASVTDVGVSSRIVIDNGRVCGVTACHCEPGEGTPVGGDMMALSTGSVLVIGYSPSCEGCSRGRECSCRNRLRRER